MCAAGPTSIIVISARTQEQEKVAALDFGADDYITKPFGTSELLARIRTALRHGKPTVSTGDGTLVQPPYRSGDLVIDFDKRLVTLKDKEVHLTQIEYKLVSLLAEQSGKVLTYDYIISRIWGPFCGQQQSDPAGQHGSYPQEAGDQSGRTSIYFYSKMALIECGKAKINGFPRIFIFVFCFLCFVFSMRFSSLLPSSR